MLLRKSKFRIRFCKCLHVLVIYKRQELLKIYLNVQIKIEVFGKKILCENV